MKQVEMSRYLKFITIGVGVLFLVFVIWFLPSVMRDLVYEAAGPGIYRGYFCVGDSDPVFDVFMEILGNLCKDWQGSVVFQRRCSRFEEDESLYVGGLYAVYGAAGRYLC